MNIGIIPMSAKPYTAGHDGLIRIASDECDEVQVFVSLSDRDIIKGSTMQIAWDKLIRDTLPDNVFLSLGGIPVRNAYEFIDADGKVSDNTYTIFSDPEDLGKNFAEEKLTKYFEDLLDQERIFLRPVERSETIDISGTKMREFIKNNDFKSFRMYTPEDVDAKKYWNLLRST
jgi:hypothetical protein